MAIPASNPNWATDANYPAGAEPEAGTPTKVALTTGEATHGYRPDQIPTAQELNWQLNLLGVWIAWLAAYLGVNRHKLLPGRAGFGQTGGGANGGGTNDAGPFISDGALNYYLPVPFEAGDRIRSFSFYVFGNGVADIANIKCKVANAAGNTDINIGTTAVVNPPAANTLVSCDCTDTELAAGDVVTISMDLSAAGLSLNFFDIVYDHGIV